MGRDRRITNINEYELKASAAAFTEAISAIAARTQAEGHPGVLSYRFFVNGDAGTAGAVIVYSDPEAWIAHHEMIPSWEEMPAFQATVALRRAVLFGTLSESMETWLDKSGIRESADIELAIHGDLAAGFDRE